jgi:hypothetical protein
MSKPTPDKDDAVLLCIPLGSGPIAAGSLHKQCDICGQAIVASRASLTAVITEAAEHAVKWWLVCLKCAPDVVPKDSKMMPVTEGQKAELRAELRRLREEDEGLDA